MILMAITLWENAFGVFDYVGNPKITYYTTKAISAYVRELGSAGVKGSSLFVTAGPSADKVDYRFTGAGGAFGTGRALASGQAGSGPVQDLRSEPMAKCRSIGGRTPIPGSVC